MNEFVVNKIEIEVKVKGWDSRFLLKSFSPQVVMLKGLGPHMKSNGDALFFLTKEIQSCDGCGTEEFIERLENIYGIFSGGLFSTEKKVLYFFFASLSFDCICF